MLQTPKVAFRDTALRDCTIERNNLGQPKPRSGNFATVYRGYRTDGSEFAVRVFNRQGDERRERYQLLNEYLQSREVWCLVNFNYDERGIRSAADGKLYPLLTMDWVPGVTLYEWARDRSREGYQQALAMGADVWLQLVRHLAENDIVHGDLQHGNVLVSAEGYFKLVDYDCMAVPSLLGRKNLETGLVPYQHPARNAETTLSPGLDNFSALVIYVALRALAADSTLWSRYVDGPGYDKLLFRQEDFDRPQDSPLKRDLMQSPDEQVRDLAHYLFELTRYELNQVPSVDEVLLWCQSLDQLLTSRDWDAAVQLVRRMGAGERIDPRLLPLVDQAQRRVACREALQRALDSGDSAEIQRVYQPELLDDYPAAAPLVARAKQITETARVLEALDAARAAQNWQAYLQTWKAHQETLNDRPEAGPYRQEVTKLLKVSALRRLLRDPRSNDEKILEIWNQLHELGGHVTGEAVRAEVERRATRNNKLLTIKALIESAPRTPTLAHDKQLVEAWTEGGLNGHPRAASLQGHVQAAQSRLQQIDHLTSSSQEVSLAGERALFEAARKLDPAYHPLLRRRAQQARDRLKAYRKLQEALQVPEGEPEIPDAFLPHASDMEVMEAWRLLERSGGQKLISDEVQCRVQLAAERVPLIKALQLIDKSLSPLERDRRILRVWKEGLLETCEDAQPWRSLYEAAQHREVVLRQIDDALAAEDIDAVRELAELPILRGFPLPDDKQQRVTQILEQSRKARVARHQALNAALLDNNRSAFHDLFDRELLQEICQQYPHHQGVVCRWFEAEIAAPERCGLSVAQDASLEEIDATHYRVRWNWPDAHISETCHLAVCAEPPQTQQGPRDVAAVFQTSLTRDQYNPQAGLEIEVSPPWHDHVVVVWAEVDLGFEVLFSQPLELGRLQLVKRRRWFG
ncbi:MAG: hypothetical protein RIC55_36160 [Pirellulaceae bacterium]